jgi:hypothetical protein
VRQHADGRFHTIQSREEEEPVSGRLVGDARSRRSRPESTSDRGGGKGEREGAVGGGQRTRWSVG